MKLHYITNGINGAGGLERFLLIKDYYLVKGLVSTVYNYEIIINYFTKQTINLLK